MQVEIKLLPIYKWTGGKRKEIKIFSEYYPNFVKNNEKYTYVEPFFGGGAVYWSLENSNKNIINDFDSELILFLQEVKTNFEEMSKVFIELSSKISTISLEEKKGLLGSKEAKEKRGLLYYEWRNKDRNNGLEKLSNTERATRFYIVNQMSFNGMRRFNRKGEFNIPYGNYKSFNCNITPKHIKLLQNTEVINGDYKKVMIDNDKDNTFIFLDPPYTREFTEYSPDSVFGNQQQIELFDTFINIKKAKVMIVINKDEFTEELYKNYIKHEYPVKYGTNIKNRFANDVKHIIITNY